MGIYFPVFKSKAEKYDVISKTVKEYKKMQKYFSPQEKKYKNMYNNSNSHTYKSEEIYIKISFIYFLLFLTFVRLKKFFHPLFRVFLLEMKNF